MKNTAKLMCLCTNRLTTGVEFTGLLRSMLSGLRFFLIERSRTQSEKSHRSMLGEDYIHKDLIICFY